MDFWLQAVEDCITLSGGLTKDFIELQLFFNKANLKAQIFTAYSQVQKENFYSVSKGE